jgi:hypothetical protein
VLGVDPNANDRDSKAAYLALSKRYHPHRFARYDSLQISRVATDIFIATKRAYTAMARASLAPPPRTAPAPRGRRRGTSIAPAKQRAPRPGRATRKHPEEGDER